MKTNPPVPDDPMRPDSASRLGSVGFSTGGPDLADLPACLPQPGQSWGKYLIAKLLGVGGQAVVHQAYDRIGPAGHVALKLPRALPPGEQREQWASNEVQRLAGLQHPNIVRIVDAGVVDGVPYLASELVPDSLPIGQYIDLHSPSFARILD